MFSQLQHIDCRKPRGAFIQIKPAALFEDLPLFDAEAWFDERKHLKSTIQKDLSDLLAKTIRLLESRCSILGRKRSLPLTGRLGLRMHVAEKDGRARPGNTINLPRKSLQIVNVADDETRKHQVGDAVVKWQSSAAPRRSSQLSPTLAAARSSI